MFLFETLMHYYYFCIIKSEKKSGSEQLAKKPVSVTVGNPQNQLSLTAPLLEPNAHWPLPGAHKNSVRFLSII